MPEGVGRAPTFPARLASILLRSGWHIAALTLAAVSTSLVMQVMMRFPHPSGADGGQWLSIVNEFQGQGVSRVGSLAYPPLYLFLLSALVSATGDPAAGIFASIAVVLFILSLSTYSSYHLITRDPKGALVFSAIVSFSFVFFDMLSWGGYPSLLSIAFFCVAIGFLHRASLPDARRLDHILLGVFGGLVFLTHPLSAVLFAIAASMVFILGQIYRRDRTWFKHAIMFTLPAFAVLYVPYLALRYLPGAGGGQGLPNYLIEQPVYSLGFAFFPLIPTEYRKAFPFTTMFTVIASVVASILALAPLLTLLHRKRIVPGLAWLLRPLGHPRAARAYLIFAATFVPILLLPVVLWWRNLYTDYSRILFYLLLPLAAGLSTLLVRFARPETSTELRTAGARVKTWLRSRASRKKLRDPVGSAPRRASRRAAFVSMAAVWAVILVFLTLHASYGLTYLRGASGYYIDFKDPADMDLARWVRENTRPDDLIALSPDWANQFKWLEGLSGRRALGYSEPRFLFYEREIQVNQDVLRMFTQRHSVTGSSFEVSDAGAGESAPYQFRFSILDRRGAYPVLELRDPGMQVVFENGPGPLLSEFVQRMVYPFPPDPGSIFTHGSLVEEVTKDSPQVHLRIESGPTSAGAELHVTALSPKEPYAGLFFTAIASSGVCGFRKGADFVLWGVRVEAGSCRYVRLTAEPPMEFTWTGFDGKVLLRPGADGRSVLRFEAPDVVPGTSFTTGQIDSRELFEKHSIAYAVVPSKNPNRVAFLKAEFGFPEVYRNAKHVVLRAEPVLAEADRELEAWLLANSTSTNVVHFGPEDGWYQGSEQLRAALGSRALPAGSSGTFASPVERLNSHHLLRDRFATTDGRFSIGSFGDPNVDESGASVSLVLGGVPQPILEIPNVRTYLEWRGGSGMFLSEMVDGDAGLDPLGPGNYQRFIKDSPQIELRRSVALAGASAELRFNASPDGPGIAAYVFAVSPAVPSCAFSNSSGSWVWEFMLGGACVPVRITGSSGLEAVDSGDVVIFRLPAGAGSEAVLRLERLDPPGIPESPVGVDVRWLYQSLKVRFVAIPVEDLLSQARLAANFAILKVFENSKYAVFEVR